LTLSHSFFQNCVLSQPLDQVEAHSQSFCTSIFLAIVIFSLLSFPGILVVSKVEPTGLRGSLNDSRAAKSISLHHPAHPRRPRGSQSGREKRRDVSFQVSARAPGYQLSQNYFQKYKRMPAPDQAQKMLCIIVPNHNGYCLAPLAQFIHQACACKGN